ncbi:MAG: hypothetical protein FWD15_05060 [Alphaproteobacteria bacterium]|nr:hypothetical protein [Alphaproteobacteria bacterium]
MNGKTSDCKKNKVICDGAKCNACGLFGGENNDGFALKTAPSPIPTLPAGAAAVLSDKPR